MKDILAFIYEVLWDCIVDNFSEGTDKLGSKLKKSVFRWNLKRNIKKTVKQAGALVSSKIFYDCFSSSEIIQNLLSYQLSPKRGISDTQAFLKEQAELLINGFQSKYRVLSDEEKRNVYEFVDSLYGKIVIYTYNQLSLEHRVLHDAINNPMWLQELDQMGLLKLKKTPEEYLDAYRLLARKVNQGEIAELKEFIRTLGERIADVKKGIDLKLFFLENSDVRMTLGKLDEIKGIGHPKVREDLLKDVVILNFENKLILEKVYSVSDEGEFKEIVKGIIEEQWELFYSVNFKCEDKYKITELTLTDYFKEDTSFRNKIVFYRMRNYPLINGDEFIELLISNKTIVDELVILLWKIENLQRGLDDIDTKQNIDRLLGWKRELLEKRDLYRNLNDKICVMFGKAIYGVALLLQEYDIDDEETLLRPELYTNKDIIRLKMMLQIECDHKKLDVQDIIEACLLCDTFVMLNNYFIKDNSAPSKIIEVLDSCKLAVSKDPTMFTLYVQAICIEQGIDNVLQLFELYQDKHGNVLEFWMARYHFDKSIGILSIYEKWKEQMGFVSINTVFLFVHELLLKGYTEAAKNVIEMLEIMRVDSISLQKLKAEIELAEGNELNALTSLLEIFPRCQNDIGVIGKIIELSLNHNRNVNDDVLSRAESLDNADIMMLLALVENRCGNVKKAKSQATKALLRDNGNPAIYSTYFSLCTMDNEKTSSIDCSRVRLNMCVVLVDEDGEKRLYCIHQDNTLPKEPYLWENAEHIYEAVAIEKGIIRKKVGEEVEIDRKTYTIKEILPLEAYLFRICLKKLTEVGDIKQFSVSEDEIEKGELGAFVSWLKENAADPNEGVAIVDFYKNFSNVALPLFGMGKRISNITESQFIEALMEDNNFIVRGYINEPPEETTDKFVLSYSTVVMLHKLGVNVSRLKDKGILVTKSLQYAMEIEHRQSYERNNRDIVATMGVEDNQPYIIEFSEDEKRNILKTAQRLKQFAQELDAVENMNDLVITKSMDAATIKDIFGISDYDALTIVIKDQKSCLVTMEPIFYMISKLENNFAVSNLIDFLCIIGLSAEELIKYLTKLTDFKFQILFSPYVVKYIMDKYNEETNEDQKELILAEWIELLDKGRTLEAEYKGVFRENIIEVVRFLYHQLRESENYIWKYFYAYGAVYLVDKEGFRFHEDEERN